MKILVFTSNNFRHIALLNKLALKGYDVDAYIEVKKNTTVMVPEALNIYFQKVQNSEKKIFGEHYKLLKSIKIQELPFGTINQINLDEAKSKIEKADAIFVFGASYIKTPLVKYLMKKNAINLHMGISPQYRGVGCNFWALYDENPHLVGATIHYLDEGLDSGGIIDRVFPKYIEGTDPFYFTMSAVDEAQKYILNLIEKKFLDSLTYENQDNEKLIRYSKSREFTEVEAIQYFERESDILNSIRNACSI